MNKEEENFTSGFWKVVHANMDAIVGTGPEFDNMGILLTYEKPSGGLMKELQGLGFELVDYDRGTGQCIFVHMLNSKELAHSLERCIIKGRVLAVSKHA